MDDGAEQKTQAAGSSPDLALPVAAPEAAIAPKKRRSRRKKAGLWLLLSLAFLALSIGFAALALTGKPLRLPLWVVVEAEARLNRALAQGGQMQGGAISLGGIVFRVDSDFVPRLRLEDLRLSQKAGGTSLSLPEARVAFDRSSLFSGQLRPSRVVLAGARIRLRREVDGRFDLTFGAAGEAPQLTNFAGVLDGIEQVFALPMLEKLQSISTEALSLTLEDARARRVWEVGDGRLTVENTSESLAMELGMTLMGNGDAPAQAVLSVVSQKATSAAHLRANVVNVAARDIAAQAPALAWLGVLDAPISGSLTTSLADDGQVGLLEGSLAIAAGALHPNAQSRPISFDRAALRLSYDPAIERISLDQLAIESKTLRLAATAQVYAKGVATGIPQEFLTQISVQNLKVDPEGLFAEPVSFSQGAADLRLRLDPFRIDVGQVSLIEDDRRLQADGVVAAGPEGWTMGLDLTLNQIAHDRLLALWPVSAVPKTRAWLANNVQEGLLSNVRAALRLVPAQEPRFTLGYEFADGDVRFLKTLPPIKRGTGYATIQGNTYTMVVDQGQVTPPKGGVIDMAGTVFSVLDILQKPAQAEINLKIRSSLTAALSLLDEKPFNFLTKAGRSVELGEGQAVLAATLRLPLIPKVQVQDVFYAVEGVLSNLSSDVLVPGKRITADRLTLTADPSGLVIAGAGRIEKLPFDARYRIGFTKKTKGTSQLSGQVELSKTTIDTFAMALPEEMVSGKGRGDFTIDFAKGQAPKLALQSNLSGMILALPEVGWRKAAGGKGKLSIAATLGPVPAVQNLSFSADGLSARGSLSFNPSGGLKEARIDRFQVGAWLDAGVRLTGRGKGKAVAVALTDGRLDLRKMRLGGSAGKAGDAPPLSVALDRVTVSDSIALTGFRGNFTSKGSFSGNFSARVNQVAEVQGTVIPVKTGTAVRILARDAGAVLASAGIFDNARGGAMDLQLVPNGQSGEYDGYVTARAFRVRNAPALAELLSAISVVGILEQLNGTGLLFNEAEARFRLTPNAVEISKGSAVGASMGVSMAGLYGINSKRLQMQGVISPIYLLNGIGSVLTRKGEGLFGFNYSLSGSSEDPQVSVNPLSILTPGMFRELFRSPPPTIKGNP